MADRRYRVAAGTFLDLQADGSLRAWLPSTRRLVRVDADAVTLLLRFGEGRTPEEAAEAAGYELDETVAAVIEELLALGLLVELRAATSAPARAPRADTRARVAALADAGSFSDDGHGSPVVTGRITIDGRPVTVIGFDYPAAAPAGAADLERLLGAIERAGRDGTPIVYLYDTFTVGSDLDRVFAGARGVGGVYAAQTRLFGRVPQVGVVLGRMFRPAAFLPALCDVLFMVDGRGVVNVGDVDAVREFTGEVVDTESLGGARMHCSVSGLGDVLCAGEDDALAGARRYLAFMPDGPGVLPRARGARPPARGGDLDALVPDDHAQPLDMRQVVDALVDGGSTLELGRGHAGEIITMLARLEGEPVGVVASAPSVRGGVLGVSACRKAARFIELCDAYGLPILSLCDVPGFQIGRAAEHAGIERAAAALFAAQARATVPKLVLVVRKAHTAGMYAMGGPGFGPAAFLALPQASIAVFGERAGVKGAASLERQLDAEQAAALREYLRTYRGDPAAVAEDLVPLSAARARLVERLAAAPRGRRRLS
jgi:acetyl-CoA carboxylase carboxyltransferase component